MIFIEKYKALVIKELPKNGIVIYVSIGYCSLGLLELVYTKQPLLHPFNSTMEGLLKPYEQNASPEFKRKFYEWLTLIDVELFMTNQAD